MTYDRRYGRLPQFVSRSTVDLIGHEQSSLGPFHPLLSLTNLYIVFQSLSSLFMKYLLTGKKQKNDDFENHREFFTINGK